jgi:hypothetical protein
MNTMAGTDRKLVRDFSGEVNCEMPHNLCVLCGVACTIPGYGIDKYHIFVEMLNRHRGTVMTKENVPNIIEQELLNNRDLRQLRLLLSRVRHRLPAFCA